MSAMKRVYEEVCESFYEVVELYETLEVKGLIEEVPEPNILKKKVIKKAVDNLEDLGIKIKAKNISGTVDVLLAEYYL